MSYGLSIKNPSGQLVLSSDAKGLTCIGKASLYGSVIQPVGVATASSPGRKTGYSVYRIDHSGAIIVALDMPVGKRVGVKSVTQPVAGTWEITCHCGDTPDAYGFDSVEYQLDVWAFGFISTIYGSYGLAMFDAAGNLTHDLSRPNMLFPRAYLAPSTSVNIAIPSLTRPVVVGSAGTNVTYDSWLGGNTYEVKSYRGCWVRNTATNVISDQYASQCYRYFDVEPHGMGDGDVYPASGFILEGSNLP